MTTYKNQQMNMVWRRIGFVFWKQCLHRVACQTCRENRNWAGFVVTLVFFAIVGSVACLGAR